MDALAEWLLKQYPCKPLLNDAGEPIERWITCPARLAFPALDKPAKMEGTPGEPKYSATLLFPVGADLSMLKEVASAAARAKFGDKAVKGALRSPFRAQGEKSFGGFVDGATYLNVSSVFKPVVLDENKQQLDATDARIYPGVWVRAKLTCYAYDQAGNKGVAFGLVSVQRLADDDKLGGGDDPEAGVETAAAVPAHLRKTADTGKANGKASLSDF